MQRDEFDLCLQCQQTKTVNVMRNLTFGEKMKRLSDSKADLIDEMVFYARMIVLEEMLKNESNISESEYQEKVERWAQQINHLTKCINEVETIKQNLE